ECAANRPGNRLVFSCQDRLCKFVAVTFRKLRRAFPGILIGACTGEKKRMSRQRLLNLPSREARPVAAVEAIGRRHGGVVTRVSEDDPDPIRGEDRHVMINW